MEKSCVSCGKTFTKKPTESKKYWETKKLCSVACSLKTNSVALKGSPWEGKTIPVEIRDKISSSTQGREANSGSFQKGHQSNLGRIFPQMRGENNPQWKGKAEKDCLGCGKKMFLSPWEIKRKFCSHRCDKDLRIKNRVEKLTKLCDVCGATFIAGRTTFRFCSAVCRGKNLSVKFKGRPCYRPKDSYVKGAAHPAWKGGKASSIQELREKCRSLQEYKDWHSAVLRRDGWKCVLCGHDRNLEVDHIISFKKIVTKFQLTDTVMALACAELWDLDNGRTLCQPCHKKTPNYGRKKDAN